MEIHGSSVVFRSLVVVKQEIMFEKAGPLSGKTEMATKVTQVEIFYTTLRNSFGGFMLQLPVAPSPKVPLPPSPKNTVGVLSGWRLVSIPGVPS